MQSIFKGMIEHQGKIIDIRGEIIEISLQPTTACSTCHAKGVCAGSETNQRTILVNKSERDFCVGEPVIVKMADKIGYKAVVIAYVMPLVLITLSLILGETLLLTEWKTGLIVLSVLAVYFITLRLFRSPLSREITFIVEKLNILQ